MNARLYTTEILRLAASLPEPEPLAREDGRAELRSPTCGSVVSVAVQMKDGSVEAVGLQVSACAFGQAAAAIMARHGVGKNREEVEVAVAALSRWLAREQDDPGDWSQLETLAPARSRTSRHGAILLPFRALLSAMEDAQRD